MGRAGSAGYGRLCGSIMRFYRDPSRYSVTSMSLFLGRDNRPDGALHPSPVDYENTAGGVDRASASVLVVTSRPGRSCRWARSDHIRSLSGPPEE